MTVDKVKQIYEGKVAMKYDASMSHFFDRLKGLAVQNSILKKGDTVLVFCCGTGADFSPILKRIGIEGRIVGVDFSTEMLKRAQRKIDKNNWTNVELVKADVTLFKDKWARKFDVGVCTLGLSIIPKYQIAYQNLKAHVKLGGEILIGDMQLATGKKKKYNPFTIFLAKRYGGSYQGHRNSLAISEQMKDELYDYKKASFFLGAYFYSIGKKV